jgi:hypothetical protein
MTQWAQIIADAPSRTLAVRRLDELLWAHIVTRSFGEQQAVLAWLREDEVRLLGGLDASLCLARTILPGWRIRLQVEAGQPPKACCDRPGYRLAYVEGADESLAVCAALLGALLAVAQRSATRVPLKPRARLWRLIDPGAFSLTGWPTSWFQSLSMSPQRSLASR